MVVIAIIAILAAILFPVFSKAREKARQTQCASNLKQIATAVIIDTQENEEILPTNDKIWGLISSPKVKECPDEIGSLSYVYFTKLSGAELAEFDNNVSTQEMVTDGYPSANGIAVTPADIDRKRHQNKCMVAYLDSHVELASAVGSPGASMPLPTANLIMNLDPATYVGSTGTWPATTGTYITASQNNATKRPVLDSTAINGQPGLTFDGTVGQMLTTVTLLGKLTNSVASLTVAYYYTGIGDYALIENRPDGIWRQGAGAYMGLFCSTRTSLPAGGLPDSGVHVVTVIYGLAKNYQIWLDGVQHDNVTLTTQNFWVPATLTIGNFGPSAPSIKGSVGQILCYNEAFDTTKREAVEGYMMRKYGLN